MSDITWDEFEQSLIKAGWSPEEEREAQEHGELAIVMGTLET